ncbi:MAG: protein-glutamate O-methyltransferase CheR [Chitinivibrionales bacterium]|nr:protein-glutamate O-methyltransferase CheR [Chitinivibrionales bacterium]
MLNITDIEFTLLRKLLLELSGIEIPEIKKYLFSSRLSEFITDNKFSGFSELYTHLNAKCDPGLIKQFIQSMTTHESSFFRDGRPFASLIRTILPTIAANNKAKAKFMPPRIRVLSAGCSHGQETYSIAMCVRQWLSTQRVYSEKDVAIVGVDISEKALRRAREGIYLDIEIGNAIPPEIKEKYLISLPQCRCTVHDDIKKMVEFSEINLSENFDFLGKFDIIFCRNVIIYFTIELKKTIFKRFYSMLNESGVLFLGASETIYNLTADFKICNEGNITYYTPIIEQI